MGEVYNWRMVGFGHSRGAIASGGVYLRIWWICHSNLAVSGHSLRGAYWRLVWPSTLSPHCVTSPPPRAATTPPPPPTHVYIPYYIANRVLIIHLSHMSNPFPPSTTLFSSPVGAICTHNGKICGRTGQKDLRREIWPKRNMKTLFMNASYRTESIFKIKIIELVLLRSRKYQTYL